MRTVSLFIGLFVSVLGGSAVAQDYRPDRPYRGLFGGGASSFEQMMSANGTLGTGYDTSVLADAADAGFGGATGTNPSSSGGYGLATGTLTYSLHKKGFGIFANGGLSARYYTTLTQGLVQNSYGSGGFSYGHSLSRRTSLNVGQTVSYQPYSVFAPFPALGETPFEEVPPPNEEFGTVRGSSMNYQTTAGVAHQLARRSTLAFSYGRSQTVYAENSAADFLSQSGAVRFTRNLSRYMALRLGYGYTSSTYHNAPHVGGHNIDLGVDYNRELSLSRRTKFAFSTGGNITAYNGDTHYNVIGNATLTREIGRTWSLSAGYNRNVGFQQTFSAPFFYDAMNVRLSGMLDRHWSFNAGGGAVLGNLGLGDSGNPFGNKYASVGVGTALNRHMQLGLDYTFYQYAFDNTTLLPAGFQQDMGRHGVRATLSAWAPVFQRTRRANAAR